MGGLSRRTSSGKARTYNVSRNALTNASNSSAESGNRTSGKPSYISIGFPSFSSPCGMVNIDAKTSDWSLSIDLWTRKRMVRVLSRETALKTTFPSETQSFGWCSAGGSNVTVVDMLDLLRDSEAEISDLREFSERRTAVAALPPALKRLEKREDDTEYIQIYSINPRELVTSLRPFLEFLAKMTLEDPLSPGK